MIPTGLRDRVALATLCGVFLIPLVVGSLRGLTHVVTCRERTEIPFTIRMPASGKPTILTAETLTRTAPGRVCPGVHVDMAVGWASPGRVAVKLPVVNRSRYAWAGTVNVQLGSLSATVPMGTVGPGRSTSRSLTVKVDPGVRQLTGSLLIGP